MPPRLKIGCRTRIITDTAGTSSSDTADSADLLVVTVQHGDVCLTCTDGLLDNVWENEILQICTEAFAPCEAEGKTSTSTAISEQQCTQQFCSLLADAATLYANDKKKRSPFEANAKRWGFQFRGGKLDDITCIASLVEGG